MKVKAVLGKKDSYDIEEINLSELFVLKFQPDEYHPNMKEVCYTISPSSILLFIQFYFNRLKLLTKEDQEKFEKEFMNSIEI